MLDSFGPMSIRGRDHREISAMNTPNPVYEVHTTTFTVRAVGVEAIRVEIHDFDQNIVFEEGLDGNEIDYYTTDKYGEYLADGIYLYRSDPTGQRHLARNSVPEARDLMVGTTKVLENSGPCLSTRAT